MPLYDGIKTWRGRPDLAHQRFKLGQACAEGGLTEFAFGTIEGIAARSARVEAGVPEADLTVPATEGTVFSAPHPAGAFVQAHALDALVTIRAAHRWRPAEDSRWTDRTGISGVDRRRGIIVEEEDAGATTS